MANRRFWSHTSAARGRRGSSVLVSLAAGLGTLFSFVAVGGGTPAVALAPVISHAPRVPLPHGVHQTWSASNWSGYAETGTYTGVQGTWTVPTVASSTSATYSSVWIGVDGFNDNNLIQTGTEEDFYNGHAHYNAWWEILPAAETPLSSSYPVAAGDRMSASIYETPATKQVTTVSRNHRTTTTTEHVWSITISDGTKWSFSTLQAYGGAGTSAEWIVEAPEVGGRIAPLAHYDFGTPAAGGNNPGDIDNAGVMTIAPTNSPVFTNAGLNYANDSGVMIQNNATVSSPSSPDSLSASDSTPGKAFNAAYGSTAPGAPLN